MKKVVAFFTVCLCVFLGMNMEQKAKAVGNFTCGVLQYGTFPGGTPTTHVWTVYLQSSKGVVFSAWGSSVISLSVYAPNGAYVGAGSKVAYTSNYFADLTTPAQTGYYSIYLMGSSGDYTLNCLTGDQQTTNTNTAYNRANAANYAIDWGDDMNIPPDGPYGDYSQQMGGGDCANFASQCVYAGGMPMISGGTTDAYWYYVSGSDRSPSWTGADFFLRHWTKVRSSGYFGKAYSVKIYSKQYLLNNKATIYSFISIGDIVQYLHDYDSQAYHTHIISQKLSNNVIKYCAHSSYAVNADWFTYVDQNIGNNCFIIVIKIRNS